MCGFFFFFFWLLFFCVLLLCFKGDATKFARGDAPSPAPTTSLSSVAPSQSEPGTVPPQTQAPQNQAFLNPPLPPGYGYTSLPYYAGVPGVPSAFQYGPTVFMPPASAKQHAQYQHQAGYGGHTYASGQHHSQGTVCLGSFFLSSLFYVFIFLSHRF